MNDILVLSHTIADRYTLWIDLQCRVCVLQ
jgi:hypothetical protein